MDESIRPRRPDEKVEEETEALLVQRVLVPSPDEIRSLRTQSESNGSCKDSCKAALVGCRRHDGAACGDSLGLPRNDRAVPVLMHSREMTHAEFIKTFEVDPFPPTHLTGQDECTMEIFGEDSVTRMLDRFKGPDDATP